jgi:hypothetical protein
MKHLLFIFAVVALLSTPIRAADDISGTWMTTSGSNVQTFIFKVKQDSVIGLVCGPCDTPTSVFKIEDGKVLDANRISFDVRYNPGEPALDKNGPYRHRVTATLSGNSLTLQSQREGANDSPVTMLLRRVVENGVSMVKKTWKLTPSNPQTPRSLSSRLDGQWVAVGRPDGRQQNFILKVEDGNKLWGLVCGPCDPDGVALIDDGTIDGDQIKFYINHFAVDAPAGAGDTPSSRPWVRRNIMRGTFYDGNVMKFKWVREGAEDKPGGEMVLIGPVSW